MSETLKKIKDIADSDYKYGFVTDIKEFRVPDGLNADIIKKISSIKKEPKWLLELSLIHI